MLFNISYACKIARKVIMNDEKGKDALGIVGVRSPGAFKEARPPGVLLDARLFELHPCRTFMQSVVTANLAIWNSHTDTWCIDCRFIVFYLEMKYETNEKGHLEY